MTDKVLECATITVRTQWPIQQWVIPVFTTYKGITVIYQYITYLSLHISLRSDLQTPCQS
jgi:hypothetical protein